MARRRLEDELVRRGLVTDKREALDVLSRGRVLVGGSRAKNPATLVAELAPIRIATDAPTFVSRGGLKLIAALDRFDIEVSGKDCLDAGASTGGFTDCLLRAGASRVISVDVAYGQLDWSLRNHPRVIVKERTNVRSLTPDDVPYRPELLVADVSFISLGSIVPPLARLAAPNARFVVLVKPQFEAARAEVEPGGVVTDPGVWRTVLVAVQTVFGSEGFATDGVMASPITGPKGNVEFVMTASRPPAARATEADIEAAIREGLEVRR